MKYVWLLIAFCPLCATRVALVSAADRVLALKPGEKQLFLDDYVVRESAGLKTTMHRPVKRGPVLKADIPSDGQYITTVSAPMWIANEAVYKMVYECRHGTESNRWKRCIKAYSPRRNFFPTAWTATTSASTTRGLRR